MEKAALIERLVRLAATPIKGTPKGLMNLRTPEQLGHLQQAVGGAIKGVTEPVKARVGKVLSKLPGGGVLQRGANAVIDNPEILPMQAIPGSTLLTPGYLKAKRGLEGLIDRVAPTKTAFATSQYSGPLNPDIRSGASVLPPFKAPNLRSALQKNSGAVTPKVGPAFGDLTKAGAVDNLNEWWAKKGGPHLARGGSHSAFKKLMQDEGVPSKWQDQLMGAAKKRYPGGSLTGRFKAVAAKAAPHVAPIAIPAAIAGGVYLHDRLKKRKEKTAAGAPTRGNFMQASDIPAFKWPRLDQAIQKNGGNAEVMEGKSSEPKKNVGPVASASINDNPVLENTSKYAGYIKLEGDAVIETDKNGKSLGKGPLPEKGGRVSLKEKDSDSFGGYYSYSPNDFKKSKYAEVDIPALVAELSKQAAFTTPAGQLAKTQSIGAPKATAPPGPSIADIAKPKGAKFGIGIPGAFKGGIGGDAGVSLK